MNDLFSGGEDLRIRLAKNIFSDGIGLYFFKSNYLEHTSCFGELKWSKKEEGESTPPIATISVKTAQELIDALWDCGLRPTEGSGSAGSFAAQGRHLEDMRTLFFNLIERNGI